MVIGGRKPAETLGFLTDTLVATGVGEIFALAFRSFHKNISFDFQAARRILLRVFPLCKGMDGFES